MSQIPKYLQQNVKRQGQRAEKKARQTINSGSLWFDKGDLQTNKYLIEVKHTSKKGFRITTSLLEKLVDEAHSIHKDPLLVIYIGKFKVIAKIEKNGLWWIMIVL